MKRDLADITKKLFRQQKKVLLQPLDLSDSTYFIYYADGSFVSGILREIENYDAKDFIRVSINTQTIADTHYIIGTEAGKILIKFIRSELSYNMNETDVVEIIGQIQ